MSKKTIINSKTGKAVSGELTGEDKLALVEIGQVFINLGRSLQEAKTYEEHIIAVNICEDGLDKAEEKYGHVAIMNSSWD